MRTFVITSRRGGTGKTTIAINLAAALADHGNTILIDFDPKSDCALGLATPHCAIRVGSSDLIRNLQASRRVHRERFVWPLAERLDLLPARLGASAPDGANLPLVQEWLNSCGRTYEYVVIDAPSGPAGNCGLWMQGATDVVVPVGPCFYGVHSLRADIDELGERCGDGRKDLRVHVVLSRHDVRSRFCREMLQELRSEFDAMILESVVHFSVKVSEAASFGQPVAVYDRRCASSRDFGNLAAELRRAENGRPPRAIRSTSSAKRLKFVDLPSGRVSPSNVWAATGPVRDRSSAGASISLVDEGLRSAEPLRLTGGSPKPRAGKFEKVRQKYLTTSARSE